MLAQNQATVPAVISGLLDSLDVAGYLRSGGMTGDEIANLHERLVGEPDDTHPPAAL